MASRHLPVTYPPLDRLKPVADGLWIGDSGPQEVFGLRLPVRMVVIRLRSGGLFLHSPTRFQPELRDELGRIGRVEHLVAPNIGHWTHLRGWQEEFSQAKIWAAPGLRRRLPVRRAGLRIDAELGNAPPEAWAGEIDQLLVAGRIFREIAFLHRATNTLLLTDLVANLEAERLPFATRIFARANGMLAPHGRAPLYLRALLLARRKQAREAARQLLSWAPERVIFAHGSWFERDGTARLERSLAWLTG